MYKPLVVITSKYTIGAFEERRIVNSASISSEFGRSFSSATVVSPFGTCRMKPACEPPACRGASLLRTASMLIKRRDAAWQGKGHSLSQQQPSRARDRTVSDQRLRSYRGNQFPIDLHFARPTADAITAAGSTVPSRLNITTCKKSKGKIPFSEPQAMEPFIQDKREFLIQRHVKR